MNPEFSFANLKDKDYNYAPSTIQDQYKAGTRLFIYIDESDKINYDEGWYYDYQEGKIWNTNSDYYTEDKIINNKIELEIVNIADEAIEYQTFGSKP